MLIKASKILKFHSDITQLLCSLIYLLRKNATFHTEKNPDLCEFFPTIQNVQYKYFVPVVKVHILDNISANFHKKILTRTENVSFLL